MKRGTRMDRLPRLMLTLLVVPLLNSGGSHAQAPETQVQQDWLPTQAKDRAVAQLADRLATLPLPEASSATEEQRLAGANEALASLRRVIDSWGHAGVLSRAPDFPYLDVPRSDDRWLDAMGRYQLCNLVLALQLQPSDQEPDFNLQFTGIMGMTGVTLIVMKLRQPYLEAGGTDRELEAFLTSEDMQKVNLAMQSDFDLLEKSQTSCSAPIVDLIVEATA